MKTPSVTSLSYEDLLSATQLARGTYVFSDIERLSDVELRLASDLYRALKAVPGCRVLNDPAKVRYRYGLLRALKEAGINGFDAYRADGFPRPGRFPVFIRSEHAHEAALTPLLPDQAALDAALDDLERRGIPLRGLVVIEFSAQEVGPGLFRRYGTFRVGERVLLDHIVTEDSWNVKWGKLGLATDEMYRADDQQLRDNAFSDTLARAFEVAGIEYGRADFGLVDGQPQVYEINTNPALGEMGSHPSPIRERSLIFARERLAEAFCAIDTPSEGPPVVLDSPVIEAHRRAFARSPLGRARTLLQELDKGEALTHADTIRRLEDRIGAATGREKRLRAEIKALKSDASFFGRLKRRLKRTKPPQS